MNAPEPTLAPEPSRPDARPWWRRRAGWLLAAAALLALGIDAGYQVYAARISHQNAVAVAQTKKNAAKLTRLTKAQCGSQRLFFDVFNALVEDSSPRFGSPSDGPPIPGARAKLIGRLYAAERLAASPLRKQGCKIAVPRGP